MSKPKVLLVLHLPPPVHGAALVGKSVRESRLVQERFDCRYINLSTSETMGEVGAFSFRKLGKLFGIVRETLREVDRFRPDLVYLTPASSGLGFLKDQLLVARLKRKGCRIVLHFHNKGVRDHSGKWLYDRLYRRFFAGVKVILLSERLYPDIARYVDRKDVLICPNGAEAEPLPAVPSQDAVPRLLFLSNLIPSKGPLVLLDACQILKKRGVSLRCVFVGKETAEISASRMEEAIASRALADTVRFEGPRYGEEKWKALSQADVFVFPTFYYFECFPVVLLEAFAASLPVVTTDEGAIPDIVTDEVNGLICRREDPASLADALETLLADESLRRKMGSANREKYLADYTLPVFEQRFVSVLSTLLDA